MPPIQDTKEQVQPGASPLQTLTQMINFSAIQTSVTLGLLLTDGFHTDRMANIPGHLSALR